ncbi:hypothetical protein Tco_0439011 [Tanacetum coccineum]
METKDTLSLYSNLDDQEMQQILKRAKILKGSCINGLSALKSNFTLKLEQGITKSEFERAFSHIFGEDVDTFTRTQGNDQGLENQSNTYGDESSRSRNECNDKSTSGDDTNIPSNDKKTNVENDQNVVECDDERVALANLIANLKLDVDENKKIQKQLKKANASLTQELTECKSILAETSRTLEESNSIRDSCLVALQNKQTEFERYKAFNDRTVDYDKLERKLNETLGLLAQKEIDIKEGLKVKAYEISVVKEKHDELVKQSVLTKSHYEGLIKEKTKVITDLKHKDEKDIDKMISMEQQLKFLNEIVYKKNQSIQTIHMLATKGLIHAKLYGGGGNPFQLKSDSLPHAHAQTTKTYHKHQDS